MVYRWFDWALAHSPLGPIVVEGIAVILALQAYLAVTLDQRIIELNIAISVVISLFCTFLIGIVETASGVFYLLLLKILNSLMPTRSVRCNPFNACVRIEVWMWIAVDLLTLNIHLILAVSLWVKYFGISFGISLPLWLLNLQLFVWRQVLVVILCILALRWNWIFGLADWLVDRSAIVIHFTGIVSLVVVQYGAHSPVSCRLLSRRLLALVCIH